MAKPPSTSDAPYSPIIFSEPISFPGRATKKRAHNDSDDGIDHDDSQKTRRVNPQRLAARLGPEIVADMEALIYPGAKMPSFEVRRVIQERYSVDRRHIYDYFHSRGLRVAKEDRHINLTRGRLSKALAQQMVEKPPPVTASDAKCSTEKTDGQPENQQRTNTDGDSPTVESQTALAPTVKHPIVKHTQVSDSKEQSSTRTAKLMAAERITGQSGLHHGRSRNTASGGISHLAQDKPLFKRRKMALATSKPLIKTSSARSSSPCPEFAPVERAPDSLDDDLSLADQCGSPELFLDLYNVTASLNTEFPLSDYQPKTPAIIEEHRALTQAERLELYNFINDSIGVSSGIMEQAGTYTAYMKERTQHYFDRILSKAYYATKNFSEAHDRLFSEADVSEDEVVDFRNWLSDYGQDLDGNSPSDSFYYSEECRSYEGKAIVDTLRHGSVTQGARHPVLSLSLNSLEPSNMESSTRRIRFEHSYHDYTVDLPRTSQSVSPDKLADRSEPPTSHSSLSHHRRHNTRLRLSPFLQKTTTQNSDVLTSTLTPNGISEIYNPLDYNNRLFLHISRPRLRTSSAGGGL